MLGVTALAFACNEWADRLLVTQRLRKTVVSEADAKSQTSAEETSEVAVSPGRARLMTMELRIVEEKPHDKPSQEEGVED